MIIYDRYEIDMDYQSFIKVVAGLDYQIKNIQVEDQIYFDVSFMKRKQIKKNVSKAKMIKECLLIRYLKQGFNHTMIIIYIISIIYAYLLSSFVYEIEIVGEHISDHKRIQTYLPSLPILKKDLKYLKNDLNQKLQNELNWLEVDDRGCSYQIYYSIKDDVKSKVEKSHKLYAQEDAMIAYFDLVDGKKVVNVHDLVKKGDLLVDDQLLDSQNQNHEIKSIGRVFGYQVKNIDLKYEANYIDPIAFYIMLLKARNEVSKDFLIDDQILEENILHFSNELGTIKMSVTYRILKDISTLK